MSRPDSGHTVVSIRRWMLANAEAHKDARTGEINCTSLVEAWDRDVAGGGATLDMDHPAWSVAVEVNRLAGDLGS